MENFEEVASIATINPAPGQIILKSAHIVGSLAFPVMSNPPSMWLIEYKKTDWPKQYGWIVGGDWCGVAGGGRATGWHSPRDVATCAATTRLRARHRLCGIR